MRIVDRISSCLATALTLGAGAAALAAPAAGGLGRSALPVPVEVLQRPPCAVSAPSDGFPTCAGDCPDRHVCVADRGAACVCVSLDKLEAIETPHMACRWRGVPPSCDGACEAGESERARCTDDCPGDPCESGSRPLCCHAK